MLTATPHGSFRCSQRATRREGGTVRGSPDPTSPPASLTPPAVAPHSSPPCAACSTRAESDWATATRRTCPLGNASFDTVTAAAVACTHEPTSGAESGLASLRRPRLRLAALTRQSRSSASTVARPISVREDRRRRTTAPSRVPASRSRRHLRDLPELLASRPRPIARQPAQHHDAGSAEQCHVPVTVAASLLQLLIRLPPTADAPATAAMISAMASRSPDAAPGHYWATGSGYAPELALSPTRPSRSARIMHEHTRARATLVQDHSVSVNRDDGDEHFHSPRHE